MVPVKVTGVSLSNMGFVVLLRGQNDERSLPVFIGAAEAQSIALHLDKVSLPRPLTHDLLKSLLDCLECRLKRIVVNDLKDSTFYALLVLEKDGRETQVDARPSDAIALALRCGAPLYVAERVMSRAGVVFPAQDAPAAAGAAGAAAEHPAAAPDAMDSLKKELAKAVREERYEDAARLRDQIARLPHPHGRN